MNPEFSFSINKTIMLSSIYETGLKYIQARRKGIAGTPGMVAALAVLVVGIATGILYQDNPTILSRPPSSVTTVSSTTIFGTASTVSTTVTEQVTSTQVLTTVSISTSATTLLPTTVTNTVTTTMTSPTTTTIISKSGATTVTRTSTVSSVSTSTVTTSQVPPSYVGLSGNASTTRGTISGIDFGSISAWMNGGNYTVSLPNPGTYTVTIYYYRTGTKSCTAGTLVLDVQGSTSSLSASWTC